MSENKQPKQFSISGYTPAGYAVAIQFTMDDFPASWDAIESRMQALNLSPLPPQQMAAAAPATKTETVTHVARRDQYNQDGTTTPHIAFYSENPKLELRYIHHYMDKPSDRAAFEAAAGLKIDDLPIYDADAHPKRDNSPRSNRYLAQLPHPLTIEYTEEPFTGEDGREGTRKRLIGYKPHPAPAPTPAPDPAPSRQLINPADLSQKVETMQQLITQQQKESRRQPPRPLPTADEASISPYKPARQAMPIAGARGTTIKQDDQRKKVTVLRVRADDLAPDDCVSVSSIHPSGLGNLTEVQRIVSIQPIDPATKRRAATVTIDGQTRDVTFYADKNSQYFYHTVVGGPKIDAAQTDLSTWHDVPFVGATWGKSLIDDLRSQNVRSS